MLWELWHDLRYRLRALLSGARLDRELDAELGFHLEQATAQLVAHGYSRPPEASPTQPLGRLDLMPLALPLGGPLLLDREVELVAGGRSTGSPPVARSVPPLHRALSQP